MTRARLAIINGFDRSGTSLIGGLLAAHPGVTYLFQPFSSTEVHKTQYEYWPPEHEAPATQAFLEGLLQGQLDRGYIASDWFEKHSSAFDVHPTNLNVIKDTKLHLKVQWLQQRFPHIAFYGVWREPLGILCSLVRNEFHIKWYGVPAFEATLWTVAREPLFEPLREFTRRPLDPIEQMAVVLAARTMFLARHLPADRWIIYEDVLCDANAALQPILERFRLESFDFAPLVEQDFNVIGKPFERFDLWREFFSAEQRRRLNRILAVLQPPVRPRRPSV